MIWLTNLRSEAPKPKNAWPPQCRSQGETNIRTDTDQGQKTKQSLSPE